jgi:hydroxysqualene dehydroxylase
VSTPRDPPRLRLAVVGGGWAGIAASVEATWAGHRVTLFEMATQLGGRARRVDHEGLALDNGQHILIGAYTQTLELMRQVGADPEALLWRGPLALVDAQGVGLRLPRGAPLVAFARGVLAHGGWTLGERMALLRAAAGWAARGFRCDPSWSVARLTAGWPAALRADLIEPLCVAALNTPAEEASAAVFLRVLRDALFAGRGSADLLLPRAPLSALVPDPAEHWLREHGGEVLLAHRVRAIAPRPTPGGGWQVDGVPFDGVIVAAPPGEAARLVRPLNPAWAERAEALRYEPIVTVYARSPGTRLPLPMLALAADAASPAQFVFDHGQLGGEAGLLAFVISGARPWVERGLAATEDAVFAQAARALAPHWSREAHPVRTLGEKRATFRCTPGLDRPAAQVLSGLWAAGDHVAGPYPATLEGAVRAGRFAAQAAAADLRAPHAGATMQT